MKLRKLKTKKTIKEKINIALFTIFFVFTLSLTVGYAAINQNFKISGEATFKPTKDCGIINVELLETSNMGLENYKSTYTTNTVSLGVDLKQLNSTITYKVTVYNSGTLAMWIDSIVQEVNNNTNMEYVLNGIGIHELINPGEIKKFNITIKYKNGISLPSNTNLDTKLKFNFINPVSTLAHYEDGIYNFQFGPIFNGPICREEVESITFVPTIDVGENAIDYWDASEEGDGSVIAWTTDKNNNGLYEVMVGGIGGVYAPRDSTLLFGCLPNVTSIDFNGYFYTPNAETMEVMFALDFNLENLDVSNFENSNVVNMSGMFGSCNSLVNLNLKNFKTTNVINMDTMFYECYSLTDLDLSSFNTTNADNMDYMFYNCNALKNINLSSFNTTTVAYMNYMFQNCASLTNLDLSGFNTANVTNMMQMFDGCKKLANLNININNFTTAKVKNMFAMFRDCSSLTSLDLSKFNTAYVANFASMFQNCSSLETLNVSNFGMAGFSATGDTLSKDTSSMFEGCSKLKDVKMFFIHTNNAKNMFKDCGSLANVNFRFKSDKASDMSGMFQNCKKIVSLDGISVIGTNLIAKNLSHTFANCVLLTDINYLNKLETSNVQNMDYMFQNTKIDEPFISDMSSVITTAHMFENTNIDYYQDYYAIDRFFYEDASYMFAGCKQLEYLVIDGNDIEFSSFNSSHMFDGCIKFKGLYKGSYILLNLYNNASYMFAGCESLITPIILNEMDGVNELIAVDASHMFYNCKSMIEIQFFNNHHIHLLDASYMFANCNNLMTIETNDAGIRFFGDTKHMFDNCYELEELNFSNIIGDYAYNRITDMSYMFNNCYKLINLYIDFAHWELDPSNLSYMFNNCYNLLSELELGPGQLNMNFDLRLLHYYYVSDTSYMFANCKKLLIIPINDFPPSTEVKHTSMFENTGIETYNGYSYMCGNPKADYFEIYNIIDNYPNIKASEIGIDIWYYLH